MKSSLVIRKPLIASHPQRGFALAALFACLVLLVSPGARGQTPTGVTDVGDTTSTPIPGAGHDYIQMLSETVNPANGSVSLRGDLNPARASRSLQFSSPRHHARG